MRINPLPLDATFTAYQQHLMPAFLYPLVAQRLPTRAINKLQSSIIIQLLHCLNLSSTMSHRLIHLPPIFGGAGIPNWAVTTCARQIEFLQSALDAQTFYGHTMRTSLLNSQLEYSHGKSLIATMEVRMEGMTTTWITNLHKSCVELGVTIMGGWTTPLQRLHDIHIATIFTNNLHQLFMPYNSQLILQYIISTYNHSPSPGSIVASGIHFFTPSLPPTRFSSNNLWAFG